MMAYTLNQLTTLEAAIGSGHLEVKFADKTTKYQTLADMRKLRDEMKAELIASGQLTSPTNASRVAYASFSRD
jgi:hypothetical protein